MQKPSQLVIIRCTFLLFILYHFSNSLVAGTIPDSLITDWTKAGLQEKIEYPSRIVSIMDFGGKNDSSGNNSIAFQNAITALHGNPGIVCFPSGKFLFKNSINIPANIILKGNSSDSTALYFNLSGNNNCINVQGSVTATKSNIISGLEKGSKTLTVASTDGFNEGDYIQIKQDGNTLMTSSWAFSSLYQLAKIKTISRNTITIESPLRLNFNQSLNPMIVKVNPIQKTGIECLKIIRLDSTVSQTNNINFTNTANCWIKGIESVNGNFAHFLIESSIHCSVEGNYIHDAFAYGAGGQGYGIVLQFGSSENFISNNIIKHLRHCILLQVAANGNVIGYNYTFDPYWVEGIFPVNFAGDIVLHGNYNFTNLVEGNIAQNIIIDNSHGNNGPFNTFFRNRAELWGINMSQGAGNRNNFVGNEITNTGFLFGIFAITDSNFLYGNNIKGQILPVGTNSIPETTLFKLPYSSTFGIPNVLNSGTNAAKTRWLSTGSKTICDEAFSCNTDTNTIITSIQSNKIIPPLSIYPNPNNGEFKINFDVKSDKITQLQIIDLLGKIIFETTLSVGDSHIIQLNEKRINGIFQLQILQNGILVANTKMTILNSH